MSKPIVIALTGKARSGKDTVAQIVHTLVDAHNNQPDTMFDDNWVIGYESFAAPLKSMVAMLLDFYGLGSIQQPETLQPYIEGDRKEEKLPYLNKSARELMQTLGTDWGRKLVHENMWVDSMTARLLNYDMIKDHGYAGAVVCITDCRFDNEAEAMKQRHGAHIVQVVRSDAPTSVGDPDHPSEAGVSPALIDATIINNGTKRELVTTVHEMLSELVPFELPPLDMEMHEDGNEADVG